VFLDNDGAGLNRREQFCVNLGSHKGGSSCSAQNQVEPDGSPTKGSLEGADCQQSNGGSDRASSVDQTGDSTERLAASTDRRVRSQVSCDSRSDDIVGSVF
jgi:hypothetical protein